jgi:hypothetical protein
MFQQTDVVNEDLADVVAKGVGVCALEILKLVLYRHVAQGNQHATDDDGGKSRLDDRNRGS